MFASEMHGSECLSLATGCQSRREAAASGNFLIRAPTSSPRLTRYLASLRYDGPVFLARSAKSWLLIALVMIVIACFVLGVLTMLAGEADLARVKIPGSNLTLVLSQDDNGVHRYDVLAGQDNVARRVILASRGALAAPPQVAVLGDRVIVTFRTVRNTTAFVEFDLAACRIVSHSNLASALPPIRDCGRK